MILYDSPIISTLKLESLHCRLQGSAVPIIPDCEAASCGTSVGVVTVCCNNIDGCEDFTGNPSDDDDIRTTFFIPNRTDTTPPPCVIIASDADNPGNNYTIGDCHLQLKDSACGDGQVWEITCEAVEQDPSCPGGANNICCSGCTQNSPFIVTVSCDGIVSGNCNNSISFPGAC